MPFAETAASRPLWISPARNRWCDILFARRAGLVNRQHVEIARAPSCVGLGRDGDRMGSHLNLFERRLLETAKGLVGRPRLILMDEPAAGLSDDETDTLREKIVGIPDFCGARVLLIDHDVELIAATCAEALVLDFGKRLAVGPTRQVLDDPTVRAAYLGSA